MQVFGRKLSARINKTLSNNLLASVLRIIERCSANIIDTDPCLMDPHPNTACGDIRKIIFALT